MYIKQECIYLQIGGLLLYRQHAAEAHHQSDRKHQRTDRLQECHFLLSKIQTSLRYDAARIQDERELSEHFCTKQKMTAFRLRKRSFLLLVYFLFLNRSQIENVAFLYIRL